MGDREGEGGRGSRGFGDHCGRGRRGGEACGRLQIHFEARSVLSKNFLLETGGRIRGLWRIGIRREEGRTCNRSGCTWGRNLEEEQQV
jgi:hypothetical protein